MSLSLFAATVALIASLSVPCLASVPNIEIETSNAAVDLQTMFDEKAKEAGCEGQTLAWLLPRSSVRSGSEADPYSDFRFFQIVPCKGDLYFYYYSSVSGDSDLFGFASLSFVSAVSDDGTYHDSFSNFAISTAPADFGCFRKSVIRNAYPYVVGSCHRVAVSLLGGLSSFYVPFFRACSDFEICWQDVADGVDPIARSFSDDYVVIKRKLAVLDCVLVPRSGNFPASALENFWCFFKLGDSSSAITGLDLLKSVRVSYFVSSYVASEHRPLFCDWRNLNEGHVYGGLYGDPSDYLDYLGDKWREFSGPFPSYPAKAVSGITYESYSVASKPTVYDVVSSGVTVVTAPDGGDPVNKWLLGHDDLVYAFDSIQRLDDASLAALSAEESFKETNGARVKPFVDLCREYRDYSDSEGSGSYDYAILLNDRPYERHVVGGGFCAEGYYTNTSCHQIDSVRLLTLTFHNDLLGGDITFSCVDTPVDTTVAHITHPYTIHVNGVVDNLASAWDKVLAALKIAGGVLGFVGVCCLLYKAFGFAFGLSSLRNGRRIRKLEAKTKKIRKR
ncbi:MAG: hypothetical protein LKG11_04915 [Bacilli bacterium]|jgi:hypothetical protein|nr:hypothetical protein [Bacilli bacterium]